MDISILTDKLVITIVLFVVTSVPFIMYQDKIAAWLSSTVKTADNKKEAKENSMSQQMFTLLFLLHSPLFLLNVFRSPFLFLYVIVYVVSGFGLLMVDPYGIITNNKVTPIVYVVTTFLAYLILFSQPLSLIMLACILVLCVSFTNIIREYTDDKSFLIYFILYTIPYCLAYLFIIRPSLLQTLLSNAKQTKTPSYSIEMNNTLLLCVLFFVLLFYLSTFFKHYYGEQLVSDPIRLSIPTELKITPAYNYTVSYWVYMDSVPPEYNMTTTSHANVVSCGYGIQTRYESSTHTFRIITKSPTINIIDTELLPQQWNHVVVVAKDGQVDVYINAQLVGTTHSISSTGDYMLIGEEAGIKGKICGVIYSTQPFTPAKVEQLYQQLRIQNPPML
jgi:hypothetical protein